MFQYHERLWLNNIKTQFESWYTLNLNCLTARFEGEGIFIQVSNYLLPAIIETLRDFKIKTRYFSLDVGFSFDIRMLIKSLSIIRHSKTKRAD